jgi:transposase
MNTESSTTILPPPPAAAGTTPPRHDPSCPNHASVPLPNDVAVLQAMICELLETLKKANRDREGLQQRFDLLVRKLYGPKAERFDPNQPWLLPEMAPAAANADAATDAAAPDAADDKTATEKPKAKGHGRKPLPKDLPRTRTEHTLTEAERICPCCGVVCQKFGEDVSEQLDFIPASLFVRQHVRFKYACPKCHDHVTVGHVPIAIFNKGLPGPGLLAQIAACKYADHLPLHRLERILTRYGIALSRSTMCDWMARIAEMLNPVVALMASIVRESKALHTDATKCPTSIPRFPVSRCPGRSGTLSAIATIRSTSSTFAAIILRRASTRFSRPSIIMVISMPTHTTSTIICSRTV